VPTHPASQVATGFAGISLRPRAISDANRVARCQSAWRLRTSIPAKKTTSDEGPIPVSPSADDAAPNSPAVRYVEQLSLRVWLPLTRQLLRQGDLHWVHTDFQFVPIERRRLVTLASR